MLGEGASLAGMEDEAIKLRVVRLLTYVSPEGKPAGWLDAAFDLLVEQFERGGRCGRPPERPAPVGNAAEVDSLEAASERFQKFALRRAVVR